MMTIAPRRRLLKTCYNLLELTPPVTAQDIQVAYRRLAARHHPDRFPLEAGSLKKNAHRLITELGLAKQFLLEQLAVQGTPLKTAAKSVPAKTGTGVGEPQLPKRNEPSTEVGRTRAMSRMLLNTERRRRTERTADRQITDAIGYLHAERFGAAQRKLGQAARKTPENADIYTLWGYSLGRQGQLAAAVEKCSHSICLAPGQTESYLCRGDLYLSQGQAHKAAADFTYALHNDPRSAPAHRYRASAFLALGQFQKAARDVSTAVDLEASQNFVYDQNGTSRSDLGTKRDP